MQFSVLGPIRAHSEDGSDCSPRTLKLRILLALLVEGANGVVSVDELVTGLWDKPPKTAVCAVQVYVSQLRKHFASLPTLIETRDPGYVLHSTAQQSDLHRAELLRAQVNAAECRGNRSEASALLSQYLALWSGPAFADVRRTAHMTQLAAYFDEQRARALQRRISLDLVLGRHEALVPELVDLVARHTHWEKIGAYLMLALFRSGRAADALAVFTRIRNSLVTSHGIGPSHELRILQQMILRGDPDLADPALLAEPIGTGDGVLRARARVVLPHRPISRHHS
ncbi:AfsR/SARP family transcriptional regulator [Nocardia puris]|uniref:AfsR/SARP family transcriptional regulator n=1 Tax=Nocardia puris TaxID=208602 RepID=UPI0011BDFD33|nr:AfsR/SARP family transcriptional regulator [Nocardia puris]MBF6214410.1 AfsR/SARP family transcriptional regulator [Nocardia puris]MBF6369025.1 AfsR/SARP family transcriptional regulator [Nocardia puris]MBF6462827.1 AfsR/SARP family transcriptional regulator [Nocardia puris]